MSAYISVKLLQKYDGFYHFYNYRNRCDTIKLTSNKWYRLSKTIKVPRTRYLDEYDKPMLQSSPSFEIMIKQCALYFQEVYEEDWTDVVLENEEKTEVVKTENEFGTIIHFPRKED